MDTYIYVQASDGTPLMPTKRKQHIQKLLKRGRARVVEHVPFVIRLRYAGPKNVQPLYGGTDPGRTNIGNAVVDDKKVTVVRLYGCVPARLTRKEEQDTGVSGRPARIACSEESAPAALSHGVLRNNT